MVIITPDDIDTVAWEGELAAPPVSMSPTRSDDRPVATIGAPEVWPAAEALQGQAGQRWMPPLGGASFWLVRLACTLRKPMSGSAIAGAQQGLYLRPRASAASDTAVYAFSLYPDRLGIEDSREFTVSLGPELTFASGAGFKVGELGAKIEYKKVFPAIQAYGVGEPAPYWIFKPHARYPLEGSQFVYAVLAARPGAGGIRGAVELVVEVQGLFGPLRYGLPDEARAHTTFSVTAGG